MPVVIFPTAVGDQLLITAHSACIYALDNRHRENRSAVKLSQTWQIVDCMQQRSCYCIYAWCLYCYIVIKCVYCALMHLSSLSAIGFFAAIICSMNDN